MKLTVKTGKREFHMGIPTGLLFNRLSAFVIVRKAKKHGILLSYRQTVKFIKAMDVYRRTHRDWVLMEADCADGKYVRLRL